MAEFPTLDNPGLWRLSLLVERTSLRVVLSSLVADSSLVQFSMPLDQALPHRKALEESVYACPGLLSDFGAVDILVHTTDYIYSAPGGDDSFAQLCGDICHLSGDGCEMCIDSIADGNIVWSADTDTLNFLRRTFPSARPAVHVGSLLKFFGRRATVGNCVKLFAHLSDFPGCMDIMVFGSDGKLRFLVSKDFTGDSDAAYYILAVARCCGMDLRHADEIQICGNSGVRATLMPLLRRYAARVVPMIFPSAALRAGREAFKAPLPLVLIPICE